jgi:hypothetical protein
MSRPTPGKVAEAEAMMNKNPFGGRAGSLYTPMSEDEQEVLDRLVTSRDLDVSIKGWGHIRGVQAGKTGDLRISIPLTLNFDQPVVPVPVYYFDLELRTGTGILLFKERQSTVYNNAPLMIGAGTSLQMVWDIAIKHMDPKLVKALKPGATGLTSRWIDKDTGEITMLGNTRMGARDKALLRKLRHGEAANRVDTAQQVLKAVEKAKKR